MSGQSFYAHSPDDYSITRDKHSSYQVSPDSSLEQGYNVASRYIFDLYFGIDNGNDKTDNNEYTGSISDMYVAMLKAGSRHRFIPTPIPSKAAEVSSAASSIAEVLNVPASTLDAEAGGKLDLDMLAGGLIFANSVNLTQLSNFFKDPDAEMRNFQRATASIGDQTAVTTAKASEEALYVLYLAALDTYNQDNAAYLASVEEAAAALTDYTAAVAEQTTATAAYNAAVTARVAAEANEDTDPAALVAAQTAEALALEEKNAKDAEVTTLLAEKTAADAAEATADATLQASSMARDMAELDMVTQKQAVSTLEAALQAKEAVLASGTYDANATAWQDANFRMHKGDSVVMVVKLVPSDTITGGDVKYVAHEFKIVGPSASDPFKLVADAP